MTIRYRKVSTRMYGDEKFRRLSKSQPCGQSLMIWLITGPCTTNIPGIVRGRPAVLAAELDWPLEGFLKAFAEVSREGMAEADAEAGITWLPNAIKHNEPQSPNVIRSWRAMWNELPESPLKAKIRRGLRASLEGMGEGFLKAFEEAIGEVSPNQEAVSSKQDPDALFSARAGSQPVLISVAAVARFDFAAVYARYPRKRGKPEGMAACAKLIRTAADFEMLARGVDAFAAEAKRLGTPIDKVPYWSTFVNERRWEDFANEPALHRSLEERIAAGELR
jgi:hypothetical protein